MEMLLNKIKTVFFILFLILQSCQGNSQENKITEVKSKINFFDKKYFEGYHFIIDESNISDHPYFSYLNCIKEGYFAVHFIPKEKDLLGFWKYDYFNIYYNKDQDLDKYLNNENNIIKKILDNKYLLYNIFSYYIPSKYLENKKDCTIESIFYKPNSRTSIYFFDQEKKEWEKLKEIQTEILPPYANNDFFISQFPKYFKTTLSKVDNIKDEKLLNELMRKYHSNPKKITDSMIFIRDSQGDLEIREDILKYIEKNTTEDEATYAVALKSTLLTLLNRKKEEKKIIWNDIELYKILAYGVNYIDTLYWKYHHNHSENVVWGNGSIMDTYFKRLSKKEWDEMENQYKNNNYYNLSNLKTWIEYAKE